MVCHINYLNKLFILQPSADARIGRSTECEICLPDLTVSRIHAYLEWEDQETLLITDKESKNGTFVNRKRISRTVVRKKDRIEIGPFTLSCQFVHETGKNSNEPDSPTMAIEHKVGEILDEVNSAVLTQKILSLKKIINTNKKKTEKLAFQDDLTGLYNRRYFDQVLKREINRAERYKTRLSLIMLDIDHFKQVNDTWGHQKGDEVLSNLADLLKKACRDSDMICRYGGEEIAVILPGTNQEGALATAEKIRSQLESESPEKMGIPITASLGVSEFASGINMDEIIRRSDSCLYKAKEEGRNRTVGYSK